MSANDEMDEFGVAEDLEDLLATPSKPAAKKAAARPPAKEPEPAPTILVNTAASGPIMISPDQLEQLKNSLRSEIEADLKAEAAKSPKSPESPRENRPIETRPTEAPKEGTAENGIRVHFIDDGFTLQARVFYRGEEFIAPADSDWARLTPAQQMARYGKQLFRQGPWEGSEFDLSDPALTDDDRAKLTEIMQKRQAAEPVRT